MSSRRISEKMILLTTAFAILIAAAPSFLMPSLIHGSAIAQTSTIGQYGNNTNELNNNTLSYSFNIYDNKNMADNGQTLLQNSSVSYYNGAIGYLVYPGYANNTERQLPAVIMIHEWWGLNEHIKKQAGILASHGYVVLAVDLFKGQVTTDPKQAMELSSSVKNDQVSPIANLQSAVKYVKTLGFVNGSKIASLGWCFGGDWSLRLATNSTKEDPLGATILYYGKPITDPNALSNIHWPVLGIYGDKDRSIQVASVKQFASALNSSGISNQIYLYKGVGHAFANPSGDSYAPVETTDAWQKTIAFLNENLG